MRVADVLLPVGDILVGLLPAARQALVDFVLRILPARGNVVMRALLLERPRELVGRAA